jgi:hypothetical protein
MSGFLNMLLLLDIFKGCKGGHLLSVERAWQPLAIFTFPVASRLGGVRGKRITTRPWPEAAHSEVQQSAAAVDLFSSIRLNGRRYRLA